MSAEPLGIRSWRTPVLIGALLGLPLLLTGCSGTRFGEALSRSFSTPADPPQGSASEPPSGATTAAQQAPAPANPATPPASPAGKPGNAQAPGAARATSPASPAPEPSARNAAAASKPTGPKPMLGTPAGTSPRSGTVDPARPNAPSNPAPYRVTIRLPQADPSAPAEVVTEALRAAGVPFEVETIERMGGVSQPAAAPGLQPATPQVRPAPPPR